MGQRSGIVASRFVLTVFLMAVLSGILLVGALTFAAVDTASAADLKHWTRHATEDGAHPDQHEQQLIWLMNRARANPTEEGRWLVQTGVPSIQQALKQYRVSERRLRKQFSKLPAAAPAAFDRRLYEAALTHARRLAKKKKQNHRGQMKAIRKADFPLASCRGNVFSYAKSAINAHAAFNIDWGKGWGGTQRGAEHRQALMSSEEILDRVGIAIVHVANSKRVGPMVVVGNYCREIVAQNERPERFIVGSVYIDANANGQFDPGEGVPNVRIESTVSQWFAVTAAGGGYALPRDKDGSGTVVFTSLKTGTHRQRVHSTPGNTLIDLVLR